MAASDGIFLQDLSDEDREAWFKKAPVPVRNYITYLEGEIDSLEEELREEKKTASYDDELGTLWTLIATRRALAGYSRACARAERAARLIQSVDGL